jgi:acetyl esterase/lipase
MRLVLFLFAAFLALTGWGTPAVAALKPSAIIPYGDQPSQRVELYLPEGRGPFPVVVFIHGGCYQAVRHGIRHNVGVMAPALARFTQAGLAVWAIEYRGIDEPGGAYPGMYQDVAAATDLLVREAPRYNLDLSRAVISGGSAGGQLALWYAGRANIPSSSPLAGKPLFHPRAAVIIAGPGNMAELEPRFGAVCGPGLFDRVVGPPGPTRFADTSPDRLFPYGIPLRLLVGEKDTAVPAPTVEAFAAAARKHGEDVQVTIVPNTGHGDWLRLDGTPFRVMVEAIRSAAGLTDH